ncbi:MAG TPA: hypothetical protein VG477_13075 [Thermoanaerobaculia bacterium]|jgi:hypothetical protein|nr:hypothetical protein [Thermoanaerobaculia bacterium]
MAEIKIEKKKGIPVWAMLLGLILLALIIWAVVEMGDDERPADVAGDVSAIELSVPAEAVPAGAEALVLELLPEAA